MLKEIFKLLILAALSYYISSISDTFRPQNIHFTIHTIPTKHAVEMLIVNESENIDSARIEVWPPENLSYRDAVLIRQGVKYSLQPEYSSGPVGFSFVALDSSAINLRPNDSIIIEMRLLDKVLAINSLRKPIITLTAKQLPMICSSIEEKRPGKKTWGVVIILVLWCVTYFGPIFYKLVEACILLRRIVDAFRFMLRYIYTAIRGKNAKELFVNDYIKFKTGATWFFYFLYNIGIRIHIKDIFHKIGKKQEDELVRGIAHGILELLKIEYPEDVKSVKEAVKKHSKELVKKAEENMREQKKTLITLPRKLTID